MLGAHDQLVVLLVAAGCKMFRFGVDRAITPNHAKTKAEKLASDLAWRTIEAIADAVAADEPARAHPGMRHTVGARKPPTPKTQTALYR